MHRHNSRGARQHATANPTTGHSPWHATTPVHTGMLQKLVLERSRISNEDGTPCRGNGALFALVHFRLGILTSVADAQLGAAEDGGRKTLAVEFEAACFTAGAPLVGGGACMRCQ